MAPRARCSERKPSHIAPKLTVFLDYPGRDRRSRTGPRRAGMRDSGAMTVIPSAPSGHSLADVMPSVAASLGADTVDSLGLAPTRDAVVVLIDGLGAELIPAPADAAPPRTAPPGRVTAPGSPAPPATSRPSLAGGAPCSQHGVMGYSSRLSPEPGGAGAYFNPLRWTLDSSSGPSAIELHPP